MNRFVLINTLEDLKDLVSRWDSKEFAFDTEFTSLSWYKQMIIGISMFDGNSAFDPVFIQFNFKDTYITKEKDPKGGRKKVDVVREYVKSDAIDFEQAKPYLLKMFENARCICANAKVEWKIFSKYGIDNWYIEDDVNLMSYLLDVDTPNGLKENAKKELRMDMPSYEDTIGQKPGNINWNTVDWYEYARYGARDAYATYKLRDVFLPRVKELPALYKCYKSLEIPLTYEVARSEMAGVSIDVEFLKGLSDIAEVEIRRAEQDIYDKVGVEFNIGSSKQLAEILFGRLGYPVMKRSEKTGERSVDEDTLKELSFKGYEIADDILEYRQLGKLKSTYIDAIPEMIDPDGRLRGSFNQQGTATGRFSSSKPNLQNQPNNKKFPIKRSFVPKPGYKFLVYDWSTIEIRIMAHESGDARMIEILNAGRDIHQETTDSINGQFGLTLTRGQGKTINFGVLYLMGAESLAYMLNKQLKQEVHDGKITMAEYKDRYISEKVAQKIIDGFFNAYPGFTQFIKDEVAEVKESGYSWTLGGRRRPVPELKNKKTFGFGRRKAVNCVDENTECFTKYGWRKYDQLSIGDELLTYNNSTNSMEWNNIDELLIKGFKGDMLSMEGINHSSLTTLDHRWYVRDSVSGKCKTIKSYEMLSKKSSSLRIPLMQEWGNNVGNDFLTKEHYKLLGIFMTDGHFKSSKRIAITQSTSKRKTGNIDEILRLIKVIGCEIKKTYIKSFDKYNDIHQIEFSGTFVETIITLLTKDKLFKTNEFIYNLKQEHAKSLLDGLLLGDGWMKKGSIKTKYISTKNKDRKLVFEDIILMAGFGYSTTYNKASEQFVICIKSRRNVYIHNLKKEIVKYSGKVWCPHLKNDCFLARRNGQIYVTQNTPIQGGAGDLMKLGIIRLNKMYNEMGFDATTLLYVHDEYVIEVKEEQAEECGAEVKKLMENIFPKCKVPIICDGGVFDDWAGLKQGYVSKPSKVMSNKKLSVNNLINYKILRNGKNS